MVQSDRVNARHGTGWHRHLLNQNNASTRRLCFALIQSVSRAHGKTLPAKDAGIRERQDLASNVALRGSGLAHGLEETYCSVLEDAVHHRVATALNIAERTPQAR